MNQFQHAVLGQIQHFLKDSNRIHVAVQFSSGRLTVHLSVPVLSGISFFKAGLHYTLLASDHNRIEDLFVDQVVAFRLFQPQ